ncbi:DUF2173 family protein [Stygiolobus caldivivus]|uniref:DUF2173 family protein n=1 Tax=Stygiolobus caldivivus TaxID=2824673 RepID=A0A8D5U6G3_9CREN|nr:DUF2173 family protein [Stygiolobus caldivivus]BCU69711.1 hypothetical protein KN1_10080 [Stygiolobus caldivivus]
MSEAKLERLMKIKGAIAAGHFSADGKLLAYKGDIPKEIAEMVAKMCAANTLTAEMQADGFSALTKMKWSPLHGWAVAAGDYAVCVMDHYGVFVKLSEADFNAIFKELGETVRS